MPSNEQIDKAVVESFKSIHLEDHEWTFRDNVLDRAAEITAAEGLLGETVEYRIGAYLLGLVRREPGLFLQKRQYIQFTSGHLYPALERLLETRKIEQRNEPRDDRPDRRRIQYSLTHLHPIYGSIYTRKVDKEFERI